MQLGGSRRSIRFLIAAPPGGSPCSAFNAFDFSVCSVLQPSSSCRPRMRPQPPNVILSGPTEVATITMSKATRPVDLTLPHKTQPTQAPSKASAYGNLAKAFATGATAIGSTAIAEGVGATAIGYSSHSQGLNTIAIGDAIATGDNGIAIGATASCLLYTSPSPRDGLLSRMPSSA